MSGRVAKDSQTTTARSMSLNLKSQHMQQDVLGFESLARHCVLSPNHDFCQSRQGELKARNPTLLLIA